MVALITGGISLIGTVLTILATSRKTETAMQVNQAVTDTKIEELTREVRKHNGFAERLPVGEEQRPFSDAFRVGYGCDGFAGSGGMVQKSNTFIIFPHLLQAVERFLLVIHEGNGASLLGRKRVLHILEQGILSQEGDQFIANQLRVFLQLGGSPAVDLPSIEYNAVLLQQVIMIFCFRNNSDAGGCGRRTGNC